MLQNYMNLMQKIKNYIKICNNKKNNKIKQMQNKIYKYLNNNGMLMKNN